MHKVRHDDAPLHLTYARRSFREPIAKFRLPEAGMAADAAERLVRDELGLDALPALNLASFVTTWMEPQAMALCTDALGKNLIDHEEYPRTAAIEQRVVSMVAQMLHAAPDRAAVGSTTVGSSEALMLAFLAHKRAWQKRQRAAGRPASSPNLVFGADAHTCIDKFASYFDVAPRRVPLRPGRYTLEAAEALRHVDEDTICVAAIAGTTFTGQLDDIAGIAAALDALQARGGPSVPLHVDAASGGFVLPFVRPELAWDFRLPRVRSINVSNHKFGLVVAGLGTLVFADRSDLPEELIFHINYLGGDMPNYSLNFSRPSAAVLAQYYMFLRLGRQGYAEVMAQVMHNAQALARGLQALGAFELVGDASLFPVVAVRLRDDSGIDPFALSRTLRGRGWVVPAYPLPAAAEATVVLRMVVREHLSFDLVEQLLADIGAALEALRGGPGAAPPPAAAPGDAPRRPIC